MTSEDGRALRDAAMAHWQEGRPDRTLELLRACVRETVDLELLNDLAVATAEVSGAERAIPILETVLDLDPERTDARENLAALRADGAAAYGPHDPRLEVEALFAGSLGPIMSPRLLGYLLSTPRPGQEALAARLHELPSATMAEERWLYYNLVAHFWSGQHDVFENGPLLGGTTRAACLGMLANPRRTPGARLHTHDWFNAAIPTDYDEARLEDLVAQGLLRAETLAQLRAERDFQCVFDELHAGHDYSPLLVTRRAALPGFPEEAETLPDLFEVPAGASYDVVLIDGCKSWYGTRWFLERIQPAVVPGSLWVMQDFGWYTCFWLSSFVGLLRDHFRLVAYAGHTYAFQLLQPLTAADVARFPEHPSELGASGLDAVYEPMLAWSWAIDDSWSQLSLSLQHAAALAYIGFRQEARAKITTLLDRPELKAATAGAHAGRPGAHAMVAQARRSPTYFPYEPLRL